jgi:hypothetical protein
MSMISSTGGTSGGGNIFNSSDRGTGTSIKIKSSNKKSNSKSTYGGSNVTKKNGTMNQSIAEGITMFNTLTGGGLDRIGSTQEYADSRQRAQQGIDRAGQAVDRYQKRATEGIGSAEREAQRTILAQQIAQAGQMAGARAGAAYGGVKGASMAAQQRSLQGVGMQALANVERDIFLKSEEAKREGEDKLTMAEQGVTLAEQAMSRLEMEKAAFDIGQSTAEVEMKTNLSMGIEGMKSSERAAQIAADAQVKAARAQSSGLSVVCTELHTQGVIDTQVWKDSEAWGAYMGKTDREFMKAYWAIGIPTVKLMQRSKVASAVLGPIFKQGFDYLGGKKNIVTKAGFLLGVGLCEISRQVLRLKNKMKVYYGEAKI